MVDAVDAQREIDDVVSYRRGHRDRIRAQEITATVDEVDDLQNGGLADRVLRPVGAFDDVQPGMELNHRPFLTVVFEGWGPEFSEHERSPLGRYRG